MAISAAGGGALAAEYEVAASSTPRVWRALRGNPAFWIGLIGISTITAAAVFAPLLTSHDPAFQFRGTVGHTAAGDPLGPSAMFPLGTDVLGRDYFSRLLYGARASLLVGVVANAIAVFIGVVIGAIAGFAGTPRIEITLPRNRRYGLGVPIESFLMRLTDTVLSLPVLLLAIALVAVVGPSLVLVMVITAAVLWTTTARIVHGQVVGLRENEFVLAARAAGVSPLRILGRHIGPHLVPIVIVYGTLGIAGAVLFEATLSFLGVGVPYPAPSWGRMISENLTYYKTDPRLVIVPGLAIMATILSFNLLGDALADALDPRRWK